MKKRINILIVIGVTFLISITNVSASSITKKIDLTNIDLTLNESYDMSELIDNQEKENVYYEIENNDNNSVSIVNSTITGINCGTAVIKIRNEDNEFSVSYNINVIDNRKKEQNIKNGFILEGNNTYYYINDAKQYGITNINGTDYFLGEYSGRIINGWVTSSLTGEIYYADETGKILKGINKINGSDYFLGEYSGRACRGWVTSSLTGKMYFTDNTGKIQKGDIKVDDKTLYFDEEGVLAEGFKRREDGNTYYYIDGLKQYGITNINGEEYFLGEYSGRVINGWVTSSLTGETYYADETGKILKGINKIDGSDYFLGEYSGRACRGLVTSSLTGKTYFTDNTGKIQKGDIKVDDKILYFDEEGILAEGFKRREDGNTYYYIEGLKQYGITTINNVDYFLGELSGRVCVGWITALNGNKYYTDETGKILKDITTIDNETYFLGELSGRVCIGWITALNGNKYYTDESGKIQKGDIEIEGKIFYFDENGILVDGFKEREDGNTYYYINGLKQYGITNINGTDYFLGELSGRVCIGWITALNGNKYYTDETGKILKGINTIDNKTYFLGELSGRVCIGWITALNGNKYYSDSDGIIKTGDQLIENDWYKFSDSGILQNGWQEINGKKYYFYGDGTKATLIKKIEGVRYEFTATGELQHSNIKNIIDVSANQKVIDWNATWASGEIDGVILRIAAGAEKEDSSLAYNLSKLKELGIPYGIYIYSYAENYNEGVFYANFTNDIISKYNMNPSIGIYLDLESNSVTSKMTTEDYTNVVNGFMSVIPSAKIYTYSDLAQNTFTTDYLKSYIEWIANYSATDCPGNYRGWQYTSKGKITGISTVVDISIFYY